MEHRLSSLAGLLAAVIVCAAAHAQPRTWEVSGRFVDPAGQPLAGAELARYFLSTRGQLTAFEPLRGDEAGAFAGTINPYKLPMVYLAYDKQRTLGARVTLREESIAQPLTITLRPLAEVRFTPQIEEDFGPVVLTTSFGWPDATAFVVQSYEPGPYRVPEGEYELNIRGDHLEVLRRPISVRAGETLEMDDVLVNLGPAARAFGKPALPIEFAEARGLAPDFTLADLKGKWVLLEFWGFW